MSHQKELSVLNQLLKETTQLSTDPTQKQQPLKPLSNEDKSFLQKVINDVKGHKDIVEEIQDLLQDIPENFEVLEEYAYDVDLATAMTLTGGLFEGILGKNGNDAKEIHGFSSENIESLSLAAICCQNNLKVQDYVNESGFLEKYLNFLDSADIEQLKPTHISLLSSSIRDHEKNTKLFINHPSHKILTKILNQNSQNTESSSNERLSIKTLFLINSLLSTNISDLKIIDKIDLKNLSKKFENSVEFSEQFVKLVSILRKSGLEVGDGIVEAVKERLKFVVGSKWKK